MKKLLHSLFISLILVSMACNKEIKTYDIRYEIKTTAPVSEVSSIIYAYGSISRTGAISPGNNWIGTGFIETQRLPQDIILNVSSVKLEAQGSVSYHIYINNAEKASQTLVAAPSGNYFSTAPLVLKYIIK